MLDGRSPSPSPSPSWSWSLSTHTKAMPHGYLWHICTLLLNMKLGHYKPNHNHGREIFSMNTKANARWSALIFLFFLSTHAYIFIIYYYMFTHTHTLTCKDNKRFVFTSNINENSSSSSASASSNQLGDVLGHTCVEDDHERWYWCCLRCWRQQRQQQRRRPGGPVVLPRALNFMISNGRWGCRICMQVGQHIHTCMSVCVCVMNVIAQIADA